MKKLLIPICCITLAFTMLGNLTSCQKGFEIDYSITDSTDTNPPVNPPVNPPSGDSIYLDKIYTVEKIGTSWDTTGVSHFKYDGLKRLIAVIDTGEYDFGNEKYYTSTEYFYSGSDTMPFKSQSFSKDDNNKDTVYSFFYYNSQKKIKDSVFSINATSSGTSIRISSTNYTYAAGKIFSSSVQWSDGVISIHRDTAILNSSGVITSHKTYIQSGSAFVLDAEFALIYDNKISPFRYLSNRHSDWHLFDTRSVLYSDMNKQTNITKAYEKYYSGFGTHTTDYTYTYKSNGLPQSVFVDLLIATTDDHYLFYTYKKL